MATRAVPPVDELTPSEIVLLKGDTFAPSPPRVRGVRARIEAELRFGGGYLIAIVIGLVFSLTLKQQWEQWRQLSWSGLDLDSLTVGLIGLVLLIGGVAGWVWMRRRAAPYMLAPPDTMPLLDGARTAHTRELATTMLMAALLANEDASAITFEPGGDGILAVPTGVDPGWPPASIEHRLLRDVPLTVSALIYDWLVSDSYDPWARAAKMAKVCAVVRGFAEEERSIADTTFRLTSEARAAYASLQPTRAETLLENCRTNWPDWWVGLRNEITLGISDHVRARDTKPGEHGTPTDGFEEPSPWELEAAADRSAVEAQPKEAGIWLLYVTLVVLMPALIVLAVQSDVLLPMLVAWGLASIGVLYASRRSETTPAGVTTLGEMPLVKRIPTAVALGMMTGGLLTLAASYSVVARIGIVLAAAIGGGFLVRWKMGQRMQQRLLELDAAPGIEAVSPWISPATPSPAPRPTGTGKMIPLEVHHARDLPRSEALLEQTDVHAQRAKALRRVRWMALLTLVGGYALLAAAFWYPGPTYVGDTDVFARKVPATLMVVLVVTLFSGMIFYTWTRQGKAGIGPLIRQIEESETHPWSLILLAGFWVVFILVNVPLLFQPWCGPREKVFAAVALAFVAGHVLWTRSALARLESAYPVPPPLRLAMLRVFGSPALKDLIAFINPWRSFGVIEHLHGPGTSGSELSDVVNVMRGRIDDSFAEDDAELDQEFSKLRHAPDRNIQFARDPIQCTLASWRNAVGRMLARADAVVMDLSNMSRQNEGCAYELGRLADEVPLSRVTLLVNDATDMACLKEILDDVSRRIAPSSPNRSTEGLTWRIVHTGGLSVRAEDESVHDWKRRTDYRLNALTLTALLRDSALPRRSRVGTGDPDAVPNMDVRWAREPLGPRMHRVASIALFLLFAGSIALGVLEPRVSELRDCELGEQGSARPG